MRFVGLQAETMSFLDIFYVLSLITLALVPLALLLSKVELGKASLGH
jgi:hypothetical protein